jgi:tRNA pseudouridine55 synthase
LTLPRARLRAIVSSGTYIRSLARDLGAALGTVATLSRLVRTRVGRFTIDDAADPAGITGENITDRLVSVREALPDVPILPIDTETARRLLCGQVVALPEAAGSSGQGFAVTADGRFLAIVNRDEQKLQVERIIYAD